MHKYVLGISMSSHDRSAALLRDGTVVGAVAEERLDRRKRSQGFYEGDSGGLVLPPLRAIARVLSESGIGLHEVDLVVCGRSVRTCRDELIKALPVDPERVVEPPAPGHHLAHAYSAYATSPFKDSAVLVLDEQGYRHDDGRFERGSWFLGESGALQTCRRFTGTRTNLSLGMFFDVFAALTGLSEAGLPAAGKLMALASYGRAHEDWPELVSLAADGDVDVSLEALDHFLESVAGVPVFPGHRNRPAGSLEGFDKKYRAVHWGTPLAADLAAHAQAELERGVLHTAATLRLETGARHLSYAGGVALNCTANSRLLEAGFEDVFVQPAATDDGCAIGLAYYGWIEVLGRSREPVKRFSSVLGPRYTSADSKSAWAAYGLEGHVSSAEPAAVAGLLAEGKLVCRVDGRSEWGPRALGHRSIIADPCRPGIVETLNSRVKFREPFRPFGISIDADQAPSLLELDSVPASLGPYMLAVARTRDDRLGSVSHKDGTIRYQLVAEEDGSYHQLLRAFGDLTGLPAVINTSFNTLGEPLVETPEDAVRQFLVSGADVLVIGDELLDLTALDPQVSEQSIRLAEQQTVVDPLHLALRHEAAGYPKAAAEVLSLAPPVTLADGADKLREFEALQMRLAIIEGDTSRAAAHAQRVLELSGMPRAAAEAAEVLNSVSFKGPHVNAAVAKVLLSLVPQGGAVHTIRALLSDGEARPADSVKE
ncbi:carbamoyltransferase C-terminal domain-containing protein [Streptomyces canus]|uniref:carbamoyltransferase C-terminal domain-containing protein n=1 Tax=Streptomyces canus TaxID=58343 RepID=UPI00277FF896|nr:carbamoyltransferase C-terminal domain-containing protein [Streptomyces canus]MDQ1066600.1 carbamoyltransferase [Streptomyces canus]